MRVEQTDTFRKWLDGLEDRAGRARVLVRIDRLIRGNPGQHRQLAGGVSELKIDVGPGYRVYYALRGSTLLLLLARRRQVDAAEGHRGSHPAGAAFF